MLFNHARSIDVGMHSLSHGQEAPLAEASFQHVSVALMHQRMSPLESMGSNESLLALMQSLNVLHGSLGPS